MNPHQYSSTQLDELRERVLRLHSEKKNHSENKRLVISIAGVPGSGKSTISENLCRALNPTISTQILPQDGFHYYRLELAEFDDPKVAFERRGAPFTFNAQRFLDTVKLLKKGDGETVYAPSFDHRMKDPVENDIEITKDTQIVFIEGNYVSLTDPVWNQISEYVDETWFVKADPRILLQRIVKRHLDAGIAATEEEARARAQGSDQLNAEYIAAHSQAADVTIVNN